MMRLFALLGALTFAALSVGQTPVRPAIEKTLATALASERRAEAYCEAVLAKYGSKLPFAHVAGAESLHAAYVEELMIRHGVPIPPNRFLRKPTESKLAYANRLEVPSTYKEALAKAVQLEMRNGPLYSKLSQFAPMDVRVTFNKLRREALRRHLPQFQKSE